jgi:hypothetical protein
MLEAAMLSGRKDPAGTLELMDVSQALYPRRVNQVLLRDLWRPALSHTWDREGNVFVNRISEQGQTLVVFLRLCWRYGPNVHWHSISSSSIPTEQYLLPGVIHVENLWRTPDLYAEICLSRLASALP